MAKKRILVIGGLLLLFAATDLLVYPSFETNAGEGVFLALLSGLVAGQFIGQLNLISVWAAISEGSLLVRLPWALLLVTVMTASVALGANQGTHGQNQLLVQIGATLMSGCVIAQIPLWIASRVGNWRLVSSATQQQSSARFNISQMFVGTTLLAVALAVIRFAFKLERQISLDILTELVAREKGVFLTAFVIVNLVVVVPCIWAAFTMELSVRNAFIVFGIAVAVSLLHFFGLCLALGDPGGDRFEWWLVILGLELGQMMNVLITLRILRDFLGFKLVRLGSDRAFVDRSNETQKAN